MTQNDLFPSCWSGGVAPASDLSTKSFHKAAQNSRRPHACRGTPHGVLGRVSLIDPTHTLQPAAQVAQNLAPCRPRAGAARKSNTARGGHGGGGEEPHH